MKDLAQATTTPAPQHPVVPASPQSLLPLFGAGPFHVNVTLTASNTVEFSSPNTTISYTDGVTWKPPQGATAAGVIKFHFKSATITKLAKKSTTPAGLTFSDVSDRSQDGTVSVPAAKTPFPFKVETSSTHSVDPQIVVTPQ
jgi:hypothetical protein